MVAINRMRKDSYENARVYYCPW